ncbi:hypothetical protein BV898_19679 [Hypsibius exemplaris]|uniref:Uncharacterized protein n=1 Tax=Hypsibius exemplaris TaxID=2072580 RepID=A0A9X6RQ02_HYPEX|nr:hypothetical protein BV898_19679 [Hypsibius exemplaris]
MESTVLYYVLNTAEKAGRSSPAISCPTFLSPLELRFPQSLRPSSAAKRPTLEERPKRTDTQGGRLELLAGQKYDRVRSDKAQLDSSQCSESRAEKDGCWTAIAIVDPSRFNLPYKSNHILTAGRGLPKMESAKKNPKNNLEGPDPSLACLNNNYDLG